jgi:quercetin 2,3-dioxygenase
LFFSLLFLASLRLCVKKDFSTYPLRLVYTLCAFALKPAFKETIMITIRPSTERGHFRTDWLDTRHTFSFDTYRDPRHMNFRTLRVINEDHVAPGKGFPLHRHENMEVITVLVAGQLKHEDDQGHSAVIGAGGVQRFSAGSGIRHSEFNPSDSEEVHLLQIWILPEKQGLTPSYEQKLFAAEEMDDRWCLLASRDGREGSVSLHQDVALYRAHISLGNSLEYRLAAGRHGWVQVITGELTVNGTGLKAGDGAAISDEEHLQLQAAQETSLLFFDLA